MDYKNELFARDQSIELCVLATIATKNALPIGIIPEYFQEKERRLFDCFQAQILKHGSVEPSAIPEDLFETLSTVLDTTTIKESHGIEILHRFYVKRETARLFTIDLEKDPVERLRSIQDGASKILLQKSQESYDHKKELSKMLTAMEEMAKQIDGTVCGIPTGIQGLDFAISGIQLGKVYLLGGLKKTGKSRLMTYLAIKSQLSGSGVLINSLEMSPYQLNTLQAAHFSGIDSQKFETKLSRENQILFAKSLSKISKCDWSICREYTVPDLKSRILHERQKRKIGVVFIDFIQRMRPVNFTKDRVRGVEEIAIGLADLSRELDVAIVELSQLTGEAENLPATQIPDMRYFKESQGICENADVIMVLHNPERNAIQKTDYTPQEMFIKIDQRYGRSGCTVGMKCDLRTCSYEYMAPHESSAFMEKIKDSELKKKPNYRERDSF